MPRPSAVGINLKDYAHKNKLDYDSFRGRVYRYIQQGMSASRAIDKAAKEAKSVVSTPSITQQDVSLNCEIKNGVFTLEVTTPDSTCCNSTKKDMSAVIQEVIKMLFKELV